jgi:hypothetical protein
MLLQFATVYRKRYHHNEYGAQLLQHVTLFNSKGKFRTLCATADQHHVQLCIDVASMLKMQLGCDRMALY